MGNCVEQESKVLPKTPAEKVPLKESSKTSQVPNMSSNIRYRYALRDLEKPEYAQKKNDFLKAWKIIKELPPSNPNSFWSIASFHGMPYKKRRVEPYHIPPNEQNNSAWNGYCQHGNILFPTWHRFYCLRIEQALQTAVPDGDVALHYWDETSPENMRSGLPPILLQETVTIDGVKGIPNPLSSFKLPQAIDVPPPEENSDSYAKYYAKPAGYATQRYPFSGITNPPASKAVADKHNQDVMGMDKTPTELLQENLVHWLNIGMTPPSPKAPNSIYYEFLHSLDETSYNRFSNTSSATSADCLEQAHNEIHLAVGGFTDPAQLADGSVQLDDDGNITYFGLIEGANGDMGENETAAYDPIFFLHHCNIDRMFWVWQKKYHYETDIPLDTSNPNDQGLTPNGQGPTPNQKPDQQLNFDTILYPFQDEYGVPRTSRDCFNVKDLGYDYAIGSLDQAVWPEAPLKHEFVQLASDSWDDLEKNLKQRALKAKHPLKASFDTTFLPAPPSPLTPLAAGRENDPDAPMFTQIGRDRFELRFNMSVKNINRNTIPGSFAVQAFVKKEDGKLYFIGQKGVLDRWDREKCMNCQQRNKTSVGFAVDHLLGEVQDLTNVLIQIVYMEPETGKFKTIPLTKPGEQYKYQAFAAAGAAEKPTIHLTATFKQQLLGPR